VSKHEIRYLQPATYGDDLALTTTVECMRGARAVRRTRIKRIDGTPVAEVTSEWVWVRATDGRPKRLPPAIVARFSE